MALGAKGNSNSSTNGDSNSSTNGEADEDLPLNRAPGFTCSSGRYLDKTV